MRHCPIVLYMTYSAHTTDIPALLQLLIPHGIASSLSTGVLVQNLVLSNFHCLHCQLLVMPTPYFNRTYPLPHLIIGPLLSLPNPSSCLVIEVRWVSVTLLCPQPVQFGGNLAGLAAMWLQWLQLQLPHVHLRAFPCLCFKITSVLIIRSPEYIRL